MACFLLTPTAYTPCHISVLLLFLYSPPRLVNKEQSRDKELFVAGAPESVTDEALLAHYAALGDNAVEQIYWMKGKYDGRFLGRGFIRFSSAALALQV